MPVDSNVAAQGALSLKMVRTCINTVQFMSNIQLEVGSVYPANTIIGTIPSDIRPKTAILVPVGIYRDNISNLKISAVVIRTNGEVRLTEEIDATSLTSLYIFFNGQSYNISRNYYYGGL